VIIDACCFFDRDFNCFYRVEASEGKDGSGALVMRFLLVLLSEALLLSSQEVVGPSKRYPTIIARTDRHILLLQFRDARRMSFPFFLLSLPVLSTSANSLLPSVPSARIIDGHNASLFSL